MNVLTQNKNRAFFSKAALGYDELADIQREIGTRLLAIAASSGAFSSEKNILDVGTGTGWLAAEIKRCCPDGKIFGIDHAPGMVAAARKRNIGEVWLASAEHLPFTDASFDAVVSNCAYQWVGDLDKAFGESARVLKAGGPFVFSLLIDGTLQELRTCLAACCLDGKARLTPMPSEGRIRAALERNHFQGLEICRETIQKDFMDVTALLRWLKGIGANGLERRFFVGRQLLSDIQAFYQGHFSRRDGIVATFEVLWGKAVK